MGLVVSPAGRDWVGRIKRTHLQNHTHSSAPTHAHMLAHTHIPHACTHTCLQSLPHRTTQIHHLWIAFDGYYNGTDRPQCIHSAFLLQTPVENLILLCCILSFCDGSLITFINNIGFQKVPDNFLCIHFVNELVPKLVQYLFSCMEREDSCYTNLPTPHVHCRTSFHH